MAQGKLNFIESFTIEQFKSAKKVEKLDVLRNHKTGKLFIAWTGGSGAVSEKGVPSKNPIISLVSGDEGEQFYLLHEQGEGGAEVVATF